MEQLASQWEQHLEEVFPLSSYKLLAVDRETVAVQTNMVEQLPQVRLAAAGHVVRAVQLHGGNDSILGWRAIAFASHPFPCNPLASQSISYPSICLAPKNAAGMHWVLSRGLAPAAACVMPTTADRAAAWRE